MSPGNRATDPPELSPAVVTTLTSGRVVEAIKMVREERGVGLKEAKEAVDRYLAAHPALKRKLDSQQAEALRGCLLWLAVLIAIATVAYYIVSGR